MARVTYVFGVLLIALGLIGFWGTGSIHYTALIPTWFGLALVAGGILANSPSEARRKLFMHINVTVGLLGLIGSAVEALRGYVSARAAGLEPDRIALAAKLTMAGPAAHLRESLRPLVHPSTQVASGIIHGNNARRDWNGYARRALAARAQLARGRRTAQKEDRFPQSDAGDLEAGAAAEMAAAAGPGAGGHQSRRRPDAAICVQTVCQSGA